MSTGLAASMINSFPVASLDVLKRPPIHSSVLSISHFKPRDDTKVGSNATTPILPNPDTQRTTVYPTSAARTKLNSSNPYIRLGSAFTIVFKFAIV